MGNSPFLLTTTMPLGILAIVGGLALLRFCWVRVSRQPSILRRTAPSGMRSPHRRLLAMANPAVRVHEHLSAELGLTDVKAEREHRCS